MMVAASDFLSCALPGAVILAGAFGAAVLVALAPRTRSEPQVEGKREDLGQAHASVVEALRALEQEKGKLDETDYARERAGLLSHGASALKALEEAAPVIAPAAPARTTSVDGALEALATAVPGVREAPEFAALRAAIETRAPAPAGLSPKIEGALWTLGLVTAFGAIVGALVWLNNQPDTVVVDRGATPELREKEQPGPEETAWLERLQGHPDDKEALIGLGWFELRREDLAAARRYDERALTVSPDDPDALVLKALITWLDRDPAGAVQALDNVLAAHPHHAEALEYRALFEVERGSLETAIPMIEKALAAAPTGASQVRLRRLLREAQARQAMSAAPTGPAETIAAGTVSLAPGVASEFPPGAVLYVAARAPGQRMPVAVKRLPPGPFPMKLELTSNDRMGGMQAAIPDAVDLTVRVDFDGNPLSKGDGEPGIDLPGLKVGTADLDLVLKAP